MTLLPKYEVKLKRSAEKELNRLHGKIYERLVSAMSALGSDPRPPGSKKLSGGEEYRIRAGDYRILYSVEDSIFIVEVTRIRHRRDAYRKR